MEFQWKAYPSSAPVSCRLIIFFAGIGSRTPKFDAGVWEHTSLPTKRLGLHAVNITELTLRIEWDGKPIVAAPDNTLVI